MMSRRTLVNLLKYVKSCVQLLSHLKWHIRYFEECLVLVRILQEVPMKMEKDWSTGPGCL